MDHASLGPIERQLANLQPHGAPRELRHVVLAAVQRELRAARWDRRLARTAAVLLVVGVGLNVVIGLPLERHTAEHLAAGTTRESLVQVAVTVAEATDARTGRQFAQQLAALAGRPLTVDEAAAIDAAVRRRAILATNGEDG